MCACVTVYCAGADGNTMTPPYRDGVSDVDDAARANAAASAVTLLVDDGVYDRGSDGADGVAELGAVDRVAADDDDGGRETAVGRRR